MSQGPPDGISKLTLLPEDGFSIHVSLRVGRVHVHAQSLNHVWVFVAPWTIAHQAPPCMGFPSKDTWWGCLFLLQGIFWPKDRTCDSCTGRQILYHWATWEAQGRYSSYRLLRMGFTTLLIQATPQDKKEMNIRYNLVEDFSHLQPLLSNHPIPNGYYISVLTSTTYYIYYYLHILCYTLEVNCRGKWRGVKKRHISR